MRLVEDVGWCVYGDPGKVLDLLGVAVEVDGLLVHQYVQLVPPLGPVRPHPYLRDRGHITAENVGYSRTDNSD